LISNLHDRERERERERERAESRIVKGSNRLQEVKSGHGKSLLYRMSMKLLQDEQELYDKKW